MLSYQIYHRWSHGVPEQLKRREYKKELSTEYQINAKIPTAPSSISALAPHLLSRFQMVQWWETHCALWRTQFSNLINIPLRWISLLLALYLDCFPDIYACPIPFANLRDLHWCLLFSFFVNISFMLFLQMTSLIIIFTKVVYFKPFFQGKFNFKFIIPVNWNYTRKLLTVAVMQTGSRGGYHAVSMLINKNSNWYSSHSK